MNEMYEFKQDLARQRRELIAQRTGWTVEQVEAWERTRVEQPEPVEAEPLDRIADALERIATALESRA